MFWIQCTTTNIKSNKYLKKKLRKKHKYLLLLLQGFPCDLVESAIEIIGDFHNVSSISLWFLCQLWMVDERSPPIWHFYPDILGGVDSTLPIV